MRHLFVLLLLLSCTKNSTHDAFLQSNGEQLRISLKADGNVNYLQCFAYDSLTDSWPLRYPVFKMMTGDVDLDGNEDIAVGVIKATRRDSVVRKRLFLYQVRNRSIIPLWLGSSLSHPLEDFTIIPGDSSTIIRSMEIESSGRFLIAEYEWFGFGPSFRRYLHRELSRDKAAELLDQ